MSYELIKHKIRTLWNTLTNLEQNTDKVDYSGQKINKLNNQKKINYIESEWSDLI